MASGNGVVEEQVKDLKKDHDNNGDLDTETRIDEAVPQIVKTASVLGVFASGVALFSDGYNAQISTLRFTLSFSF